MLRFRLLILALEVVGMFVSLLLLTALERGAGGDA